MTNSARKRSHKAAIWAASSYWGFSPVPKSPSTRNFNDPSRLGNGTAARSAAAGRPWDARGADCGPAGPVTGDHSAAATRQTRMRRVRMGVLLSQRGTTLRKTSTTIWASMSSSTRSRPTIRYSSSVGSGGRTLRSRYGTVERGSSDGYSVLMRTRNVRAGASS